MRVLVFILGVVNMCLGANILAVSTLASKSHYLWHKVYLHHLVQRGHNVTFLTHFHEIEIIQNYTVITLEGVHDKARQNITMEEFSTKTFWENLQLVTLFELSVCKLDVETDGWKSLLSYPPNFKFDLIIWDLNAGKCLYPIIDQFGSPPLIGTSPFGNQPFMAYILGNHIFSHIPFFQNTATSDMTLFQRFQNFMYVHVFHLNSKYWQTPLEDQFAKEYFGPHIHSVDEYERNISLILANSDPILNYPESFYPNSISVGGLQTALVKELPKDIKNILDAAKDGVILFSLGSNLNINKLQKTKIVSFFKAFEKLPSQTILIKSPGFDFDLPKNVIVKSWLPQNDILAHPNVKLFITHGGGLSTHEAVYHGVPVIGIPFFLDQHGNMAKLSSRKVGKTINYEDITDSLLYDSIKEVLNNPIYSKNMKLLSKRFRDQPQSPLERAIFWTEYVLRHGGAEFLSPPTRDMNIFQRFDLDIYGLLLVIIILKVLLIYKLGKVVYKSCIQNVKPSKIKSN